MNNEMTVTERVSTSTGELIYKIKKPDFRSTMILTREQAIRLVQGLGDLGITNSK